MFFTDELQLHNATVDYSTDYSQLIGAEDAVSNDFEFLHGSTIPKINLLKARVKYFDRFLESFQFT